MKKQLLISLLLSTTPLLSSCFSWEWGARMGYRQDQVRYQLYAEDINSQPIFRESFNRLRSAQVEGLVKFRLWWLEIGADANYSWIESGDVKSTSFLSLAPPNDPPSFQSFKFNSDGGGNLWDVYATGGLRVPAYTCNCNCVAITVLGGYSWHRMTLERDNFIPETNNIGTFPIDSQLTSNPTLLSLRGSEPLSRGYKGPFAGGQMHIYRCNFMTYFGYAFHWIDLDQSLKIEQQFSFFLPPSPPMDNFQITLVNKNRYTTNRDHGHRAWAFMGYSDPCGWRVGVRGTYFLTSTDKRKSQTTLTTITPLGSEVTTESNLQKARWQTFSVLLEGAYEF